MTPQIKEIKYLKIVIPANLVPNNLISSESNVWFIIININSGKVIDWPFGKKQVIFIKAVDYGSYYLLDENKNTIYSIEEDYVPNSLIPGGGGDEINLRIDEEGNIINWYNYPSIKDFR